VDRRTPKAQKGGDKGDRDVHIEGAFISQKENFLASHRMRSKDIRRDFQILIKNKLQNSSGNYETNLMILINPSLAHVGTVALKVFMD
jgi:hypothetical protein